MDYDTLTLAFGEIGATASVAEAHGLLCGLFSTGNRPTPLEWIEQSQAADASGGLYPEEQAVDHIAGSFSEDLPLVVLDLHSETLTLLEDNGFDFQLILPGDFVDLSLRGISLGLWCQGFLFGLACGGLDQYENLPDIVQEVISDFVEISRATHEEEGVTSEEDETAYMELVEYVRAGVVLLFEELQPADRRSQVIH